MRPFPEGLPMSLRRLLLPALAAAAMTLPLLAAPALAAPAAMAPAAAKPVEAERLYSGRWLEIARLPMKLTDGCVAGATDYRYTAPDKVEVTDTCQVGAPGGKTRSIKGHARLLDPGANANLRVHYPFFITWDFRILDHAEDYSWFISSDPRFEKLWIYTRAVPSKDELAALVARVKALGYDPARLEFPAQPPA
jgi:apolipoprotein D and lipocalin family protein